MVGRTRRAVTERETGRYAVGLGSGEMLRQRSTMSRRWGLLKTAIQIIPSTLRPRWWESCTRAGREGDLLVTEGLDYDPRWKDTTAWRRPPTNRGL
jgi:hypothetical protein